MLCPEKENLSIYLNLVDLFFLIILHKHLPFFRTKPTSPSILSLYNAILKLKYIFEQIPRAEERKGEENFGIKKRKNCLNRNVLGIREQVAPFGFPNTHTIHSFCLLL